MSTWNEPSKRMDSRAISVPSYQLVPNDIVYTLYTKIS